MWPCAYWSEQCGGYPPPQTPPTSAPAAPRLVPPHGWTPSLSIPAAAPEHNATKVSADALYSVRKFSFGKVYTARVGNLLYRVSHKVNPCAVLLESFENFETDTQAVDIRRTFRLSTNLGNLKLTTGRKSLIKLQILMYKTVVYTLVNGVITHQKRWSCSTVHWHLGSVMLRNITFFDICCFWCVMTLLTSV